MSSIYAASSTPATPDRALTVRAGLIGGLAGGIIIWIYEALVWVGVQHLMPLAGIPRNATGLVFGKQVQEQLGTAAYFVGTGIHFLFALAWGVLFAVAFLLHRAARVDRQTAACCNRLTPTSRSPLPSLRVSGDVPMPAESGRSSVPRRQ